MGGFGVEGVADDAAAVGLLLGDDVAGDADVGGDDGLGQVSRLVAGEEDGEGGFFGRRPCVGTLLMTRAASIWAHSMPATGLTDLSTTVPVTCVGSMEPGIWISVARAAGETGQESPTAFLAGVPYMES